MVFDAGPGKSRFDAGIVHPVKGFKMATKAPEAVNYWPESKCAKAFWGQHELPPYQRLLADTIAWCEPQEGQRWLDLGCGCGQLTKALWQKSQGKVRQIIGLDCAAVNDIAFEQLRRTVTPRATADQINFCHANFSDGLGSFADGSFDGAISGLAIQYAESFDEKTGTWTTDAYDHLLREVCRLLRPGGCWVFSVNVPEPGWKRVALASLTGLLRAPRITRYVKNSLRMMKYGSWLTREARRGRFHYLAADEIEKRLSRAGFTAIEHKLSYVKQAYVLRCRKPMSATDETRMERG
jgi:ubiquinone/menaquinone biosynthesis C-methylase UbiE